MNESNKQQVKRVGFHIPDWCDAVGIGVSTFYTLSDDLRPQSVLLRRRRIITESPADYLGRIANSGDAEKRAA